jgi:hypothetical protein
MAVESYRNEAPLAISGSDKFPPGAVVRGDQAKLVEVQVGHERDMDVEITGGIRLHPGAAIRVLPPSEIAISQMAPIDLYLRAAVT